MHTSTNYLQKSIWNLFHNVNNIVKGVQFWEMLAIQLQFISCCSSEGLEPDHSGQTSEAGLQQQHEDIAFIMASLLVAICLLFGSID